MFVVKVHSLDKRLCHLFHRGVRAEIAAELVHRHLDIFGAIPSFKSKKELVNDEFDGYLLTCGVPAGDYHEIRRFFETYLTDKDVRRAIEDKKFQLLGTQIPSYTFSDLKRLGVANMNSVIGYVNDNVNLSRFM